MGKRVKAKAKNPRKAQQREPLAPAPKDAGSGDALGPEESNPREEAEAVADCREQCGHYGRDRAHMNKVLLEIMSSQHAVACEHCRDEAPRRKDGSGGKEKGGKQQKKKGGAKGAAAAVHAKVGKSNMWICLDCGRHFCGGIGTEAKPYGHARRHAKQDRHWWAAQYDDPTVAYCLSCDKEVSIEMPKVETTAAEQVDDKVIAAAGGESSGLANWHNNVIRGLPNLGNTCFFNAVLQSLLALDTLRVKMSGSDAPKGPLAMSLRKLFMETGGANDVGGALSPKNLFSSMCSKYPQFKGYQMHDSHELLRCFLDGLRMEETDVRKLDEDAPDAEVPTIVDSLFGGQLSSTVSSTECTHTSVKHDEFLDLSLPVPSKRPPSKSVASPPPKRTKQSIRDKSKSRRYGKNATRVSPTIEESNKENVKTTAEGYESQIRGSELGQVVSEKAPEPSKCSESCASVTNQEPKAATDIEDLMCWLDYVADGDENKSEILDSADSTEVEQIWQCKDTVHSLLQTQDDALPKEQVSCSEHSDENVVEDPVPSQPVILLPDKEFDVTAKEMDGTAGNSQNPGDVGPPPAVSPVAENDVQVPLCRDVEEDDYVGLGDMFDEPEVTSEAKKETATVEDIDVMAWSCNSADDEVDNSNFPVSVEGCLALYTEPEVLAEPWHCEHCSNVGCLNANEGKYGEQMTASVNKRKDGEEMMASFDEKQEGEKNITGGSEKKDGDQIMESDGCSNNVNSNIYCKEVSSAKPSFGDPENSLEGDFLGTGSNTLIKPSTTVDADQAEQSESKTCQKEQPRDLNNLVVESTSFGRQPHGSDLQHNAGDTVNRTAEETNAELSCDDKNSASCSTNNIKGPECDDGVQEAVTSSLQAEKQTSLLSAHDNEDVSTQNQDRRKRMEMVGKSHQVQGRQNQQKENKTKVFRAAMRRILISKAPPVLTINLNRFSHDSHGRSKKLKGHVGFKEMLDIRPFMDPRSEVNVSTNYRLVGVVEHSGSMAGGHYVAYVRAGKIGGRQQQSSSSESWFYASDAQVKEVSLQQVLKCEAYILFYERIGG